MMFEFEFVYILKKHFCPYVKKDTFFLLLPVYFLKILQNTNGIVTMNLYSLLINYWLQRLLQESLTKWMLLFRNE